MASSALDRIVKDARTNAALSWVLVVFVLAVAAGNLATGEWLWAGFAATVAIIALIPAGALRSPLAMVPWEVLLLAVVPLLGRTFSTIPQTGALAQYLAVAALALIIAVELHTFTTASMNAQFAVVFVVIATMAAAGIWAVARWIPDVLLGTEFILESGVDEETIERDLMLEFVYSTLAGLLGGIIFQLYFRRRARIRERNPA